MSKARILADYVAGGTTAAEFDYMDGVTSNVQTQMDAKAPLASPAFTGTPTGITAAHITSGVLPVGVTGGSGLTALGTVTSGDGLIGGIKAFQQFRLDTLAGVSGKTYITSNITEVSGGLNSNVTESSGVFSFALTGIYWITANWSGGYDNQTRHAEIWIDKSVNTGSGDTYDEAAIGYNARFDPGGADVITGGGCSTLFDVTNTTTHKIKFGLQAESITNFHGHATINKTYFTFLRLGDT